MNTRTGFFRACTLLSLLSSLAGSELLLLASPCCAQGDAFDSTACTGAQIQSGAPFEAFPGFYLETPDGRIVYGTEIPRSEQTSELHGNYTGFQTVQVVPRKPPPTLMVWNADGTYKQVQSSHPASPVIQGVNTAGTLRIPSDEASSDQNLWKDLSHEDDHSDVFFPDSNWQKFVSLDDVFSPGSEDSLVFPGNEDPFSKELSLNQEMDFSWNLWQPARAVAVNVLSDAFDSSPSPLGPRKTKFVPQPIKAGKVAREKCPVLQGATNGTIGPAVQSARNGSFGPAVQGAAKGTVAPKRTASSLAAGRRSVQAHKSPTRLIPETERLSRFIGKTNVVFVEPGLNFTKLNSALKTIERAPVRVVIQPAIEPVFNAKTPLNELLTKLAQFDAGIPCRQKMFKIKSTLKNDLRNPGKAFTGLKTVLWGEAFNELPASPGLKASICLRASELESDPTRKLILQGRAACYRKDWNLAWKTFESVFKSAADSPQVVRAIADIYALTPRDLETCIWLTRYLRIAPDWESFQLAFNQRATIDDRYLGESLKLEEGNICWQSKKMPLKVFMGNDPAEGQNAVAIGGMKSCADSSKYDQRLQRMFRFAFNEWRNASGLKLSYVETNDRSEADICCYWSDYQGRYKEDSYNPNVAPTGKPGGEHLGDTSVLSAAPADKNLVSKAEIHIYADQAGGQRTLNEDILRAICLHELGHALGIRRHLRVPAVMFPSCDQNDPMTYLREEDTRVIKELYKEHPVVADSVESFINQHSTPIVERDESGSVLMLVSSGKAPVPTGLIMDSSQSEDDTGSFIPFVGYDLGLDACLAPDYLH